MLLVFRSKLHHSPTTISSSQYLLMKLVSFSSTTTTNNKTLYHKSKVDIISECLAENCKLSSEEALRVAKSLPHFKSLSKIEAVLQFLVNQGFTNSQIGVLIRRDPKLLHAKISSTLEPKIAMLRELGFSPAEVAELASRTHFILRRDARPKIEFWRSVLGSNRNILNASKRNVYMLSSSLNEKLLPNLSLLRQYVVSEHQVRLLLFHCPAIISQNPRSLEEVFKRVQELGIPQWAGIFWQVVKAVSHTSEKTIKEKLRVLKGLGFSEDEVFSAIRKHPSLVNLSERKLRSKMDFLLGEVGCSVSYVASSPILLAYSLEKRLIPRSSVLKSLITKKLLASSPQFSFVAKMSDQKFIERFIRPHKQILPGLEEAYVAACAGKVASLCLC